MRAPTLSLALLLLAAAPAAGQNRDIPRAGEVSLGVGFGFGTRMGPELMLRVMASDDVGLACKASGFYTGSGLTCGTELYVFADDAYYVVAELGQYRTAPHNFPGLSGGGGGSRRGVFANLGVGWEVRGDSTKPDEYVKQIRGWTAAGLSLSLAAADTGEDGVSAAWRPYVRPSFWWDLVGVAVVPNARQ
jgi:hypothetical protein